MFVGCRVPSSDVPSLLLKAFQEALGLSSASIKPLPSTQVLVQNAHVAFHPHPAKHPAAIAAMDESGIVAGEDSEIFEDLLKPIWHLRHTQGD